MDKIRNNKKQLRIMGCIIGILAVAVFGMMVYVFTGTSGAKEESLQFNSDWTASYNGKTDEHVSLYNFVLNPSLEKGDTVTLSKIIPQNWNMQDPVIVLETHDSTLLVKLDGKEIYRYGWERHQTGDMVGGGRHFISLDDSLPGQKLEIIITNTENVAIPNIEPLVLTEGSQAQSVILQKYRVPWIFGNFLFVFGLALVMVGFVMGIIQPIFIKMMWLGMLSICIGIWSICYYKLSQMYNIKMYQSTLIEYFVFIVGAIPVLMYFRSYVRSLGGKALNIAFNIILGIQVFISGLVLALHYFRIVYMPSTRGLIYIMMGIIFAYVVVFAIKTAKKGNEGGRIIIIGLVIAIAAMMFDLFKYFIYEKIGVYEIYNINGMTAIGATIMVFLILISLGLDISRQLKINAKQEVFYKMAYTDVLTQLFNRRYSEEKLEELSNSNKNYGIYNFDLNYLKKTNDKFGHSYGDMLIKGFADILTETFGEVGIIGRMGGDEYIVIISDTSNFDYREYVDLLNKNIALQNAKTKDVIFSVAYGYADSNEVKNETGEKVDSNLVYTLADNRMYENKMKMKTENKIS